MSQGILNIVASLTFTNDGETRSKMTDGTTEDDETSSVGLKELVRTNTRNPSNHQTGATGIPPPTATGQKCTREKKNRTVYYRTQAQAFLYSCLT